MQLQFFNAPDPEAFNVDLLPSEVPVFVSHEPNWSAIEEAVNKYRDFKNIVVVGHGGSITSFYGMYEAFKTHAAKQAYFVNTVDPDYIAEVKSKVKPQDTVVVAVSKSGETVTQIEALMQFTDFPMVFITGKDSPLDQIAQKLGATVIPHPPIGGRYTGLTEVALLPAALCGLDIKAFYKGAKEFYDLYSKDNLAWRAASVLHQLEEKGFIDVFMPFYSHRLFGLNFVIVQLCHESFGKDGKGQTYSAFEAPESQHHTNQRFFGGRKNMIGFFTGGDKSEHQLITNIPASLHSIVFKDQHLAVLNKIPLQTALGFELTGTLEDAKKNGIPLAYLSLASVSAESVGSLIAFWQLYAVYASLLRKVNPFDQPQVEASKELSFKERLKLKTVFT